MQSSQLLSLSPSFHSSSYSSGNKLAEIAARVVEEFRQESGSESDFDDVLSFKNDDISDSLVQEQLPRIEDEGEEEEERNKCEEDDGDHDDDDFEFPSVCVEPAAPISADEIFYNGQIRPVFPIFGKDMFFGDDGCHSRKLNCSKPPNPPSVRVPLGKLLREDRDPPSSCSSSEADDLDGVPAEMYCAWTPKAAAECKKSNSTGSSKRWKFRDLLYRSNSDGRESFVFLSSSSGRKKDVKVSVKETTTTETGTGTGTEKSLGGKVKPHAVGSGGGDVVPVTAAQETHYVRNGVAAAAAGKDGDRRRSYLPYRQDLVGIFTNVNGLNRNLHPF